MQTRNQKTHIKKIRKGLTLYKTTSSPYYFARIWVSGERKYVVRSTKEVSKLAAEEVAEELLHDLKQGRHVSGVPKNKTFKHHAYILINEQKRQSGKTRNSRFGKDDQKILEQKGGVIDFFGHMDIASITTRTIRDYLNFLDDKRDKPLAPSTKTKHTTIIRKVFKVALEDRVIDQVPLTPKVSIKDNPRPSFSENEYKHLLKTTRQVIEEGVKVRGIPITMELYYFINFMVHSFLRPLMSEIFAMKHQDITVKENPSRLEIKVYGKTGYRVAITTNFAPDFYDHMTNEINPDYQPEDFVFFPDYPNRKTVLGNINRQFNYLLERSDLKLVSDGTTRSLYSLRHYSLQTRLRKSKGKVNIYTLAKVAGTSVEQLERFYLKNMEFGDEIVENLQSFG